MILFRKPSIIITASAIILFFAEGIVPVAAQAPTITSEQQVKTNLPNHLDGSGLNNEDVNALINTLEDPEARSRLVEQLRILKSGLDAGSSTLDANSSNAADK